MMMMIIITILIMYLNNVFQLSGYWI